MAEEKIRYPVFDETPRRSQSFSRFEFERGNAELASRAEVFSKIYSIPFGTAVKLIAKRDGLEAFI